jgi:superfamily II DNA/RNA helicase
MKENRFDTSFFIFQVLKGVSQYAVTLPHHPQSREQDKLKFEALLTLLTSVTFSQCLVFTNYVIKAESFCERLNQHGWPAIFIASSQDQPTRLRALAR